MSTTPDLTPTTPAPRVWLITGANSGLGLALALHVLAQGDRVIAAVRRIPSIPESLGDAKALALDVSASDAEIKRVAKRGLEIYGRIDVLVNNAGYGMMGPLEELEDQDIKSQFQTNFFGVVSLTQALLPAFRAQRSGHILSISSIVAFDNKSPFAMYNASKAALEAASETLSEELASYTVLYPVMGQTPVMGRW
ncbi:hypothetical protein C8J57DRAFT_1194558 [Mycena rebaudengoi]|nr:hypothetical protein C8J57DRAFT_1194558 [Mycena rebaudengoi]